VKSTLTDKQNWMAAQREGMAAFLEKRPPEFNR
jgi:hypothetical protein